VIGDTKSSPNGGLRETLNPAFQKGEVPALVFRDLSPPFRLGGRWSASIPFDQRSDASSPGTCHVCGQARTWVGGLRCASHCLGFQPTIRYARRNRVSPRMRIPQSGSGNALSAARPKEHLLRILGVGFGIAVIIGVVIGSGILRSPGLVAAQLRNPGLIIAVWLVGGIYAFWCTLSVTELGRMLPRAGGWYVYSRRAFGEYAGFLVGCMDWIADAVAIEYLAVAFGDFAAELQPSLHGYVKVVPVASVGGLTLLNWLGLRAGSRMQELTSMVKTLALIAFVVACFAICPHSAPDGDALPASLAAPELRSGCNVHQLGFDVEFTAMLHHAPRQHCIDMQIVIPCGSSCRDL
jgi:hypothetical protein